VRDVNLQRSVRHGQDNQRKWWCDPCGADNTAFVGNTFAPTAIANFSDTGVDHDLRAR
jgi:hypothetical protein